MAASETPAQTVSLKCCHPEDHPVQEYVVLILS